MWGLTQTGLHSARQKQQAARPQAVQLTTQISLRGTPLFYSLFCDQNATKPQIV